MRILRCISPSRLLQAGGLKRAPCGAGLSYEQPEASRRLNAPAEKATETTAAMRELAERRYTV